MEAAPLSPELRAAAPDVARRLADAILMPLAALIAHAFLHDPRHVAIIVPLWTRLTRTARRVNRLMERLVAGIRPRPARPGSAANRTARSAPPPVRFPTTDAWLVVAVGYRAAAYASRLRHLLSDPVAVELIAATPQVQRLLRPLCRMLGVTHPAIPPLPRRRRRQSSPAPAVPRREAIPARRESDTPARTLTPDREPPPRPLSETAPCEHVFWPWFPLPYGRHG